MNGVDLSLFEFDYDMTWAGFFMNAEERIYSRYGSRDASDPMSHMSLEGLRRTMRKVLKWHAEQSQQPSAPPPPRQPTTPEEIPTLARRINGNRNVACLHCHQVYDYRREYEREAGAFKRESVWVYPLPENIGLRMDVDEGNLVREVMGGTPAHGAGVQAGDVVDEINGVKVFSIADVQWALHNLFTPATFPIRLLRGGKAVTTTVTVSGNWRRSDLWWRQSLWSIPPDPGFIARDLDASEKEELGIPKNGTAVRIVAVTGNSAAEEAGLQVRDTVIAVDGVEQRLSERQLQALLRAHYAPGDKVKLTVLRERRRETVTLRVR